MALFTTHAALGGGIAALGLVAVGAEPNAVSIGVVSAVALRSAWPDLAMVWPSVKAMYWMYKAGEPKWWKARDWEKYDEYHHPVQPANEDPLFKLHRFIDRPFHRKPDDVSQYDWDNNVNDVQSWWGRLWYLDMSYLIAGLSMIYFSFWWLM